MDLPHETAARLLPDPSRRVERLRIGADGREAGARDIPEETPVALVHDGATTAVMLATPADLEDFAYGFTWTEGLVARPDQIRDVEIVRLEAGIEARIWLDHASAAALAARRRRLAGPTGCGLCGLDSLAEAISPPRCVGEGLRVSESDIHAALMSLTAAQALGGATRSVHAAAWWAHEHGLVAMREDVGRHNALDKLAGALARRGAWPAGMLVLTSRVSVEMVQKAAVVGAEVVVAVSAPTALAVRTAEAAGITLVAVARADGFEVFTRTDRIS